MDPSSPTEETVLDALRGIQDPDLGRDIVSLGFVKDLEVRNGKVSFRIELTTPACPVKEQFRSQAEELVGSLPEVSEVEVRMDATVAGSRPLLTGNQVPGVKNVFAVSSGKGGVGKSTVAVNLAAALARAGCKVGLLDADIYGPNVPLMLGIQGKPRVEDRKIVPFEAAEGLKVISMGFMVDEDQPIIWRGPMVHGAIQQFLFDVEWGELDYLVVDLPPGTGDAQLSLSQACHLMGAILVTTPQDVSVHDVKKAVSMFQTVNVPVIGIIENMAGLMIHGRVEGVPEGTSLSLQAGETPFQARTDGGGRFEVVIDIFGSGGAAYISGRFDVPILGHIPLDPAVRVGGDRGKPVVLSDPDSMIARKFQEVAGMLVRRVSTLNLS